MTPSRGEVTSLLVRWSDGDQAASDRLLPLVYQELRQAAASCLRQERSGHTLQTSDLIHEVYLRLFDTDQLNVSNRGHFLAVATRVMRRILVDHARRQHAEKRIGADQKLPLEEGLLVTAGRPELVLRIDEALAELRSEFPERANLVELRFFGGFSETEAAEILGKSRSTVSRDWRFCKLWLRRHLGNSD